MDRAAEGVADLAARQQSAIFPYMKTKREAETMFRLTVRISRGLADRAKIRAVHDQTTLQELVTTALETYLKTPRRTEGSR